MKRKFGIEEFSFVIIASIIVILLFATAGTMIAKNTQNKINPELMQRIIVGQIKNVDVTDGDIIVFWSEAVPSTKDIQRLASRTLYDGDRIIDKIEFIANFNEREYRRLMEDLQLYGFVMSPCDTGVECAKAIERQCRDLFDKDSTAVDFEKSGPNPGKCSGKCGPDIEVVIVCAELKMPG